MCQEVWETIDNETIGNVLHAEPFILSVHLWTFFVKEKAPRRHTGGHSSFSQQAT